MKADTFTTPIKYFALAGAIWAAVSALCGLFAAATLVFRLPVEDFMSYGTLRPLFTQTLIFGSLLSFTFAGALYIISSTRPIQWPRFSLVAFGLQQAAVILGIVTIAAGINKGREFGEFTYHSDDILLLSQVIFLAHILITVHKATDLPPAIHMIIVSLAGGIVVYFFGNFSLPHAAFNSVPLNTGIKDAAVQEFYRTGILGFLVIGPAFALLYHYLPHYARISLNSNKAARVQVLLFAFLAPLAGGAGLVHSTAPAWSQTFGIMAGLTLDVAILIGFVNIRMTVTQAPVTILPDSIMDFLKWGIRLLFALLIVRAMESLRSTQAIAGLLPGNGLDISLEAIAALLVATGVGYIVVQTQLQRTIPPRAVKWHAILAVIGVLLIISSSVVLGLLQGIKLSLIGTDGKLRFEDWASIYASGGLPAKGIVADLVSLRGLSLLGFALLACAGILGAWNFGQAILESEGSYSPPNLHGPAKNVQTTPQAHGAH